LPEIIVGVSGASGSVLAQRAVEALGQKAYKLSLVFPRPAELVWRDEMEIALDEQVAKWQRSFNLVRYDVDDLSAAVASGNHPSRGMIVIPASMATVAAIAHGTAANLLLRAADVTLKESRRLVIVPRETPLSAIHLENLWKLARLGVRVVPPMPAFYTHPKTVEEIVNFVVKRALSTLEVEL